MSTVNIDRLNVPKTARNKRIYSGNYTYINNAASSSSTSGAQGIQGTQGITGAQGLQGITGSISGMSEARLLGRADSTGYGVPEEIRLGYGLGWDIDRQLYVTTSGGSQGIQGIQGVQGTQGTQSAQGIQGTIGSQGIQGRQGTSGSGFQGIQGIQGIQGANAAGSFDNYERWNVIYPVDSIPTSSYVYSANASTGTYRAVKFSEGVNTRIDATSEAPSTLNLEFNAILPFDSSTLTTDVSISGANTYYNILSLSITPGTYLITSVMTAVNTVQSSVVIASNINDGTGTLASGNINIGTARGTSGTISLNALYTTASNKTIYLSAASSVSTSSYIDSYLNFLGTGECTKLSYVKIA